MYGIKDYWVRRLSGARRPPPSVLSGWNDSPAAIDGFVEPELVLLEGDPEVAKILIVSAPGAVGKSSLASYLGQVANFALIDLAQTSPLGGNFFKGGLANAFGMDALSSAAAGHTGLIVDALDEAQLRAGPQGYEAGLLDLATIAASQYALPTVMFGRAIAAEEAYVLLSVHGFDLCLFQIEFFDEVRSAQYLLHKLPIIASRNQTVSIAYHSHADTFNRLAAETRQRLTAVKGGDEPRFGGYAPVLDAICEFTLNSEELNPQSRLASLESSSQIGLIQNITSSILDREQNKLVKQFLQKFPDLPSEKAKTLYAPVEQLGRISAVFFGSPMPTSPTFSDPAHQTTYAEMVDQLGPQHPFLSGLAGAANLVFAAYVIVWALTETDNSDIVRKAVRNKPWLISGVLFELCVKWLSNNSTRALPLADIGVLFQSLSSRVATGQRASLDISEEADEGILAVEFEVLERADPITGVTKQGPVWGAFHSSTDTALELRTHFRMSI